VEPFDPTTRFFRLVKQPTAPAIEPSDFQPIMEELLAFHPGLEFLQQTAEFQEKYVRTVIARIFFEWDPPHRRALSLRTLRRSNLVEAFHEVDIQNDINQVNEYFSYEHFYVLYCKFWELDTDHDYLLSRQDLNRLTDVTHVLLDRVEWRIIPDASTSASALQTGEVDWYEQPAFDLLPTMQRNRDIRIEITDPLGSLMMIRFNQLHPPFDKPAIRQAVLMAVDQNAYLDAVVGNLPQYKALCRSMYACNTPLGRDQGAGVMPANLERARQALRAAGYSNEKVIILGATDNPQNNAMAQVTTDLLRRLGMNVELVATDWSALLARRANRNAPERGGWSIFHTSWVGVDVAGPALHLPLRTHGAPAWAGWPDDPQIEALRNQFLEAPNPQEAERIALLLQARAFESVPFVPLGQFIQPTAFRRNVQGIVNAPVPYFWGVSKS
jgi:ABC-type transport system substrate-binding protein